MNNEDIKNELERICELNDIYEVKEELVKLFEKL
jgi:hypothetical protein